MCRPPIAASPGGGNQYSPPEPAKRPNDSHQSSFPGRDHRARFRSVGTRGTCQCTRARQCAQSQCAESQCAERQYSHLHETGHCTRAWAGQRDFQETEPSVRTNTSSDGTATHLLGRPRTGWTGSPAERAGQRAENEDAEPAAPYGDCEGQQRSHSLAGSGSCSGQPQQASLEAIHTNPLGTGRPLNGVQPRSAQEADVKSPHLPGRHDATLEELVFCRFRVGNGGPKRSTRPIEFVTRQSSRNVALGLKSGWSSACAGFEQSNALGHVGRYLRSRCNSRCPLAMPTAIRSPNPLQPRRTSSF
jgi:hypothetical protein